MLTTRFTLSGLRNRLFDNKTKKKWSFTQLSPKGAGCLAEWPPRNKNTAKGRSICSKQSEPDKAVIQRPGDASNRHPGFVPQARFPPPSKPQILPNLHTANHCKTPKVLGTTANHTHHHSRTRKTMQTKMHVRTHVCSTALMQPFSSASFPAANLSLGPIHD